MADRPTTRHQGPRRRRASAALTFVEVMIVIAILGVLAVLAAPAFRKVRALAQDNTVRNNLRQLTTGSNAYFLEMGVSSVNSATLLERSPSRDGISITPVAGETYPTVLFKGAAVTASGIAGQRTVTFSF